LNLTWAGSQRDFVRHPIHIVPAPVKGIFEKRSDEISCGIAVKLYRTYNTVMLNRYFGSGITAIIRVLRQIVRYPSS